MIIRKTSRLYKELRHIYRSAAVFGHLFGYINNRFFVRPKIRKFEKPLDRVAADTSYSIHLLCSHADLDMLLWSLASWHMAVPQSGQVYIHEDGSFTFEDKELIARLLPHAKIVEYAWATKMASELWLKDLPDAKKYREAGRKYIFATKLIDPRFVSDAPARLLLDTDVLWFRRPDEVLDLLHSSARPFFIAGKINMDWQFAEGSFLDAKLSAFNAGIIGYNVGYYAVADLEAFCSKVGPNSNSYFFEQVGHAWILSRHGEPVGLKPQQYIIKGRAEGDVIAKHYTGPRREQFWYEGVAFLKDKILR